MTHKSIIIISILFAILVGGGPIHGSSEKSAPASDRTEKQLDDVDMQEHHDENVNSEDDHENHIHVDAGHEKEAANLSTPEHREAEGEKHDHGEETDIIELTRAQQKEIGLLIAAARPGSIQNTLSFSGEIRLDEDRMVHIIPLVSGIVRTVSASLGENVREGQELARIDSPELAEMKADYLEKLRDTDLARSTFERKDYLWQENIASEADRLEARAAFQNAETLLLAAKQRLMAIGLSEKEILYITGAGDDNFGRHSVTAPISGTIIARHITRGEKIDGTELFIIADLSKVWADLQISAKDIRQIEKGFAVEIISAEGRRENGKLSLVGPVINEESRTVLGRVILENPEGYWKPGQFVTGRIPKETISTAVVVPADAVQNIDGETVIFVPEGDGFKPVDVVLGRNGRDMTEIVAGIEEGDRYVAKGAFSLKAIKVTSGIGSHAGHGH